jgi:hypothetical protein
MGPTIAERVHAREQRRLRAAPAPSPSASAERNRDGGAQISPGVDGARALAHDDCCNGASRNVACLRGQFMER